MALLDVRDLKIAFYDTTPPTEVVKGISFSLEEGETLGIVGESGSGKSVSAKAIMGILAKNGTIDRGQITFSYYRNPEERVTREILQMKKEEIRRHINGKRIAMVFQDPMTSLNPLMPVGKQIMEGMIWHYHTPKEEAYKKALELMKLVGIVRMEKVAALLGRSRILTYGVLPVLGWFFMSSPGALTLGKLLPEKSKPGYEDALGTTAHPLTSLFPHVVPSELFVWLGVAAGVKALGLPVTSLALRYIAAAMLIGLIRGIITEYLFLRLSKRGNAP